MYGVSGFRPVVGQRQSQFGKGGSPVPFAERMLPQLRQEFAGQRRDQLLMTIAELRGTSAANWPDTYSRQDIG